MDRPGLDLADLGGRTALVTGASSGIGLEFAGLLAARGSNLVVAARSADRLDAVARDLSARHGVDVEPVVIDLALPGAAADLGDRLSDDARPIDILVNNAGFGLHGDLAHVEAARLDQMVQLNIGAVVALTARLLPGMLERSQGVVINVASTAAFQPVPHMATYAASKAFVLSFSRALWAEAHPHGVDVLALCPGTTQTEFFAVAGEAAAVGERRTTEQVVDTALQALVRRRPSVVDGRRNAVLAALSSRLPERAAIAGGDRAVRPQPVTI